MPCSELSWKRKVFFVCKNNPRVHAVRPDAAVHTPAHWSWIALKGTGAGTLALLLHRQLCRQMRLQFSRLPECHSLLKRRYTCEKRVVWVKIAHGIVVCASSANLSFVAINSYLSTLSVARPFQLSAGHCSKTRTCWLFAHSFPAEVPVRALNSLRNLLLVVSNTELLGQKKKRAHNLNLRLPCWLA